MRMTSRLVSHLLSPLRGISSQLAVSAQFHQGIYLDFLILSILFLRKVNTRPVQTKTHLGLTRHYPYPTLFYSKNSRRRVIPEPPREVERQVADLVLKRRVGVRPEQLSDHPRTPVAAVVHRSPVQRREATLRRGCPRAES